MANVNVECRLRPKEGDIPATLVAYLNEASTVCPCGHLFFDDGIVSEGGLNLLSVSDSVCGDKVVPMELTLCSSACLNRFALKSIIQ